MARLIKWSVPVMRNTLWSMMSYICDELIYVMPTKPPRVEVIPHMAAHGTHVAGLIQLMKYDCYSAFDRSILLHETVHYVQYVNNVSEPEEHQLDYKEIEALHLQDKYLREHGLKLQDFTTAQAMVKMIKDEHFSWETW